MGILNVTPDSFYDGGNFSNHNEIIKYVSKMISEGADIIDVGGYSSRPGAKNISVKEEEDRVIPIVKLISKTFRETIISVDTFRSEIATKALDSGASIINDISGGELDPQMYKSVSQFKAPYIIKHMKGMKGYNIGGGRIQIEGKINEDHFKKGQKVKYQLDRGSSKALRPSTGTISKIKKMGNYYQYTIMDGGPVPVWGAEIIGLAETKSASDVSIPIVCSISSFTLSGSDAGRSALFNTGRISWLASIAW